MSVRLVVTITAALGKSAELARAYRARCEECAKEPGCEQFEVFQSVVNSNEWQLERWSDQAALDTHAKLNSTHPHYAASCALAAASGKIYQYNRAR